VVPGYVLWRVVGLAYMLVTSIIDWLRGLTFERYENG
jgi:hypothetical protein